MEELKEEDLMPDETEEKQPSKEKSYVFLYLAAAYLVYNGYSLCSNFIHKEEGAALPFFLCGIAFIVIAIGICVYAFRNGKKRSEVSKDILQSEKKEE